MSRWTVGDRVKSGDACWSSHGRVVFTHDAAVSALAVVLWDDNDLTVERSAGLYPEDAADGESVSAGALGKVTIGWRWKLVGGEVCSKLYRSKLAAQCDNREYAGKAVKVIRRVRA